MSEIGVMHVLDTLALGGAERAAVNLANELPRDKYRPYLCASRAEGPLRDTLSTDVGFLGLRRKNRVDLGAIRDLADFLRKEKIAILHAHGSSLFFAACAARLASGSKVIWHAHYGRMALENRRAWAHRLALRSVGAVITVNRQLSEWCTRRLAVSEDKVWCIPNMVCASAPSAEVLDLPGRPGSRIVCVANLRAEKDHLTLIRAMDRVVRQRPDAHLLLVGAHSDPTYSASQEYFESVRREITRCKLSRNVSFLGQRQDVPSILRFCDIGVLSSKTEGLPVSLLEYGMCGRAVIATRVGECEEVLDRGGAGILVPPESPRMLGDALVSLLCSPEQRAALGQKFSRRVQELYSSRSIMKQVCGVYDSVVAANQSTTPCTDCVQTSVQV